MKRSEMQEKYVTLRGGSSLNYYSFFEELLISQGCEFFEKNVDSGEYNFKYFGTCQNLFTMTELLKGWNSVYHSIMNDYDYFKSWLAYSLEDPNFSLDPTIYSNATDKRNELRCKIETGDRKTVSKSVVKCLLESRVYRESSKCHPLF